MKNTRWTNNRTHPTAPQKWAALALAALGTAGTLGGGWLALRPHTPPQAPRLSYTAQGYGGFVVAPKVAAPADVSVGPAAPHNALTDPVRPVRAAYNAGRYAEAAEAARSVMRDEAHAKDTAGVRRRALARQILAYSAARTHDLAGARVQFAALRTESSGLPGGGVIHAPLGDFPPTLTEDAAFQHAVCTGALGDVKGAEAEYLAFMKQYPESPLVMAALKRLQRMHGGEAPPAEEAVWKQAMETARRRQSARAREASLCGPECLAELLRRRGEKADVHALAAEMGTDERGTTLAGLAKAAKAHGFPARGLALTAKGLADQPMPAITLVMPGHYVVVEAMTPTTVTVWDPDEHGVGHGDRRAVTAADWSRSWGGVTLALDRPVTAARRTAEDAPVRTVRG